MPPSASAARLSIYDFDQTLFRSPRRPPDWKQPRWWRSPASLQPPFVAQKPFGSVNPAGQPWWNLELLHRLHAEEQHGRRPVIVTGRLYSVFAERLHEILVDAGLQSLMTDQRLYLADHDGREPTLHWKLRLFRRLLNQRSARTTTALEMVIYEDRSEHAQAFSAFIAMAVGAAELAPSSRVVLIRLSPD